jgi:L-threonylcarbamoyladenylate synthase
LAERFLPGGLTLVLHKLPSVSSVISGGGDKIAVRVPGHPIPLSLIRLLGGPITGTSANLTGRPDPLSAEDVRRQIGDSIDLIIDGGRCPGDIASTVIDLTTEPPVIVREGAVSRDDIATVCEVCVKEV